MTAIGLDTNQDTRMVIVHCVIETKWFAGGRTLFFLTWTLVLAHSL